MSDYDSSDDEDYNPKRRRTTSNERTLTPKQKLKKRINESLMPQKAKHEAQSRLDNDDPEKSFKWVEHLLRIPFGKKIPLPVNRASKQRDIQRFFDQTKSNLDDAVYGMQSVKEEVVNYVAQFISTASDSMPRILGLRGSPGCGKTAIIRNGFAKAMNRPIKCISMGGIRDSNYFLGHDYTYVGSRYGIIVESLINMKCMNGILFMDEVDKISQTFDGSDIQNLLLHITDPVQNSTFHDKYFGDIDIDLSKMVFVFSFNDEKLIDPILRDRIYIINVPDPTMKEKIVIRQKYLLKELSPNIGFKRTEIILPAETVEHIIKTFCHNQKGVRGLKKCIESILLKLNTARYVTSTKYKTLSAGIKIPFTVTKQVADDLIDKVENPEDKYLASMYL